jgi:regulatory protein
LEANPAYVDALKWLARRELSEAQVRQRLTRRGHATDLIDDAVARLRGERAIDDARTAAAIARTEVSLKRRGKSRVRRRIESAGISSAGAKQAVEELFEDVDENALLEASLARRLRGSERVEDDRQFQRLYRYLTGQGFESDRVIQALKARSVK